MFCIVYGFSNAALHNWHTPSTWAFLAAGVVLLAGFVWRQYTAREPLLPPRLVADRTRERSAASGSWPVLRQPPRLGTTVL